MLSLSQRPGHNQSQPGGCGCDLWTPIAVFGKCVRLVTANGADVGGWSYPSTIGSRYLQHLPISIPFYFETRPRHKSMWPAMRYGDALCLTGFMNC